MKVSFDTRTGQLGLETKIEDCNLVGCVDLVEKLDGQIHTLASFLRKDGKSLLIGGGPKAYVVVMQWPNFESYSLSNNDAVGEVDVELCVGGQIGDFPNTIVVDLKAATRAVEKFFDFKETKCKWIAD